MLRVPAAMPLPSTAGARGAPNLGGAPGTWRLKSVARFVGARKVPDRLSDVVAASRWSLRGRDSSLGRDKSGSVAAPSGHERPHRRRHREHPREHERRAGRPQRQGARDSPKAGARIGGCDTPTADDLRARQPRAGIRPLTSDESEARASPHTRLRPRPLRPCGSSERDACFSGEAATLGRRAE
jgi:hypothetical protein